MNRLNTQFAIPRRPATHSPSLYLPRGPSPAFAISPVLGLPRQSLHTQRTVSSQDIRRHSGQTSLGAFKIPQARQLYRLPYGSHARTIPANMFMDDLRRRTPAISRSVSAILSEPSSSPSSTSEFSKTLGFSRPNSQPQQYIKEAEGTISKNPTFSSLSDNVSSSQQPPPRTLPFGSSRSSSPIRPSYTAGLSRTPSISTPSLDSHCMMTNDSKETERQASGERPSMSREMIKAMRVMDNPGTTVLRPRKRVRRGSNPNSTDLLFESAPSSSRPQSRPSSIGGRNCGNQDICSKDDRRVESFESTEARQGKSYKELGDALLGPHDRHVSETDAPGEGDDEYISSQQSTEVKPQFLSQVHRLPCHGNELEIPKQYQNAELDAVQVGLDAFRRLSMLIQDVNIANAIKDDLMEEAEGVASVLAKNADECASVVETYSAEFEARVRRACQGPLSGLL